MKPLSWFEAVGIELEYMIVDTETLAVRPIAERALVDDAGIIANEVEHGDVAWSNELARHVIEIKTNGPVPSVSGLAPRLSEHLARIDAMLAPSGARLLGTAMHPLMDPAAVSLWPFDDATIYRAFDRIFSCRGHGWANLQSMHINLPFQGDDELHRLHSAIRAALPILPALAASSPVVDGRVTGALDTRLRVYRDNCRRIPSVTGQVVPEVARSRADYEQRILARIYDDLAPLDPDGTLRHEWVNARGAIARFDRMAVEIRVLDVQEHPASDMAIAAAVIALVRALGEERYAPIAALDALSEARLAELLEQCIQSGDGALIADIDYLAALGWRKGPVRARDLWLHVAGELDAIGHEHTSFWRRFADAGCLARRIVAMLEDGGALVDVYRQLADELRAKRAAA